MKALRSSIDGRTLLAAFLTVVAAVIWLLNRTVPEPLLVLTALADGVYVGLKSGPSVSGEERVEAPFIPENKPA